MTEVAKKWIREQARFNGIFKNIETQGSRKAQGKFDRIIPLTNISVFAECQEYVNAVFESGFDGSQTALFEEELARYMGLKYAVALSSGQAALTLAIKLAAQKLYGSSTGIITPNGVGKGGCLEGKKVFCPNLTTADKINPIIFEGGEPVFIDCADDSYTMDAKVLSAAFEKYPDVKLVVLDEPYGFPGDVLAIRQVCFENEALLIECAGDSFGASYWVGKNELDSKDGIWAKTGALGDYCVLDFGKGRIIGAGGGALVTREYYDSKKAGYWAGSASTDTPWMQHEELGYSFAIGETEAAWLRGQLKHIDEITTGKKRIYENYFERLDGQMAQLIAARDDVKPNYCMTVMTVDSNIEFNETRNDRTYTYTIDHGTAAPMEIYDVLWAFGAKCSPVYKPMSLQPVFRNYEHFTHDGAWRQYENFDNDVRMHRWDNAKDYFDKGIVLPGDVSMSEEEQGRLIDIIYACYDKTDLDRMDWM